jgi:DNA transposition AAA+ family ATPase
MGMSKIAIEAGVPSKKLQTWSDTKEPSEKIEQRLAAWLEEIDRLNADERDPELVDLDTNARIMATLEFARKKQTMAIIVSDAGLGKTESALRYREDVRGRWREGGDPKVFYFTAAAHCRSVGQILQALASAVTGYPISPVFRNSTCVEDILYHINPGDLIICDEAQFLEAGALDSLRFFFDTKQVGIALLGNSALATRLSGKGRRALFSQLTSRIGIRLHIDAPKQSDVDLILESWQISGRSERDFAQQIAAGPGGIRQMVQLLRQARVYARSMKQPVNLRVMRTAAGALGL